MDGDKKWTQRLVSSCMQCSLINTSFLSVYHSVIAVNIANFVVAARKESHRLTTNDRLAYILLLFQSIGSVVFI